MDKLEKTERQKQTLVLKFEPFLPCTTEDCTNEATVGTAVYIPRGTSFAQPGNCWELSPLCRECHKKLLDAYGASPE
jgi:hypothetical protein